MCVCAGAYAVFLRLENEKIAADVTDEEKKGDTHMLTKQRTVQSMATYVHVAMCV